MGLQTRARNDSARHWKISDADYQERAYWDDYIAAYEDMLRKTSTKTQFMDALSEQTLNPVTTKPRQLSCRRPAEARQSW
jgi:hypothetical protein